MDEQINKSNRREFLMNSAKATLAVGFGAAAINSFTACGGTKKAVVSPLQTGFQQSPLPYAYNALEPAIDTMTMEIHYTKHAATYATNLQQAAAAENVDMSKPLETVLNNIARYTQKMRNNAGGHYNHEMFWKSMRPRTNDNRPSGKMNDAIESAYGSFGNFKLQFSEAARNRFGSGWAWLVLDGDKKLRITSTPNQDNPLMDIAEVKGFPLLGLDVWEHAYYLKYQNKRPDYVDNWWNVVNWAYVDQRFSAM